MKQLPDRLRLAHVPTPIQRLARLSKEIGKNVWVWRDDLTGFADSGNKLRKLEFLAYAAEREGATRLITCGGPQSNHARATAFVARRLGLDVTLIVREPKAGMGDAGAATGNRLLNRILGADLVHVPFAEYQKLGATYDPFLEAARQRSLAKGETPYVVPEGGSCPLGCFGYVNAVDEMLATWEAQGPGTPAPDSLFLALGSGGTHAGLHLGFERRGLPTESLYAVNVCDSEAYFQRRVGKLLEDTAEAFGVALQSKTLQIFDGHFGEGYAVASDADLRFYADLAAKEGVLLDPVYTGKAFQGMLREIKKDPRRFGENVLFLHSGGVFATFAFAGQYHEALGHGAGGPA